ncbi:hypothetical protein OAB20_00295 [Winogradskyella sp.]|nr:hypothetical protein [Winogradskyella sp.]
MQLYIKNLVKRLSQFSQRLDSIELFVDKKWVLIDEEGNQQSYIFERNGDLVMSKNGIVKMGKWKLYPEAQSIKIDRIEDQILLNQAFFDKALMILKYDGYKDKELFTLVDINLIPDLNIKYYLQSIINVKCNVTTVVLNNYSKLYIYKGKRFEIFPGMDVTIDSEYPENGEYLSIDYHWKYIVKNGRLVSSFYLTRYLLKNDLKLVIQQKEPGINSKGDLVFVNGKPAEKGKYKLGVLSYIHVENGKTSNITFF